MCLNGARAFGILLILTFVACSSGCSGGEGQLVRDWTLHASGRSLPVRWPVHLDAELTPRVEHYRLTTSIALDEDLRHRDLDLVIPSLPAPVALRVAGAALRSSVAQRGSPIRHVGAHRWEIPESATRTGQLALELEVTHRWTQSAWLDVAPRLIPSGTVTPVMQRNRLLNDRGGWLGLIGLSQMGLTFLAVYFWDRRQRAYLWFAIQALTASYYPAYVLGLTIGLGPKLETLLLAESLCIAPIISVYYTSDFFRRDRPHRFWIVLLAAAMLVPVPAIFPDFIDSSYGTPGVIACVAATITYQIWTGTQVVSTYADRGIGIFFLCCWLALGGSAWIDLWAWIGGGEVLAGGRPACIGLGLFGIFQCLLLSRSHVRSLAEADRLNLTLQGRVHDLQERQAEIEALNEELRQQVRRRSTHILAALARNDAGAVIRLEAGDLIESRYRVIGPLGSGGMGSVYEVERLHDQRRFALKVALQTRGMALARLAREAQLATRVRHPNVVRIVDADVASAGYVYVVMELVSGCSLALCEGRRDVGWNLKVLMQILEGLQALHAQGIVHRDLKAANVLLSGDLEHEPHVKVTDFGISRGPVEPEAASEPIAEEPTDRSSETVRLALGGVKPALESATSRPAPLPTSAAPSTSSTPQLTRTGAISGTPSYIAPELALTGAEITPATDVFSFGVLAYRLLTGTQPHAEAPFLARLDKREPKRHVPLAVSGLPHRIADLLEACLSFSAAERPEVPVLIAAFRAALRPDAPPVPSAH